MRVYVAGPMTGYDNYNLPAFFAAADELRAAGYDVENPGDNTGSTAEEAFANAAADPQTWEWYLRRDLKRLLECDTICLLEGWEYSRGARLEQHVASKLRMRQSTVPELIREASCSSV